MGRIGVEYLGVIHCNSKDQKKVISFTWESWHFQALNDSVSRAIITLLALDSTSSLQQVKVSSLYKWSTTSTLITVWLTGLGLPEAACSDSKWNLPNAMGLWLREDLLVRQANLVPLRDVLHQPVLGKGRCDVELNLLGMLTTQGCV